MDRRYEAGQEVVAASEARQFTAILPGGRAVRLAVSTPVAPARAVRDLARTADWLALQHAWSTRRRRRSIRRLSRRVAEETARVGTAKVWRAARVRRRLVVRYNRLDARVTKAVQDFRARVDKQLAFEVEAARRLRRRDLWDKIVIASSLPLFAAYGEAGQPFSTTNVALTLSLLIWLVGDDVVQAVFGSDEKSAYPWRDTDIWSYLAPFGNLLTGWWLFGDRQHERFIAGTTTIALRVDVNAPPGQLAFHQDERVDLSNRVAPDDRDDFETHRDVRVVATVRSIRPADGVALDVRGLHPRVSRGHLHLAFDAVTAVPVAARPATLGDVTIAWIVDTADPPPANS